MFRYVIAGLLLTTWHGSSLAQEPFDWAGAYAGVHVGYGLGHSTFTDETYNGLAPFVPLSFGVESSGVLGGLQAGYNWQAGNAIVGVEGEIGYLNLRGSAFPPGVDNIWGDPYDAAGTVAGGWYGGLSARLGYAHDQSLFYVKAGALYADAKLGYIDTCTTLPCGGGTVDGSKSAGLGYLLGAGIEHAMDENWALKLEYAYSSFGTTTIVGVGGGTSAGTIYDIGSSLSAHTLKIGVNYNF